MAYLNHLLFDGLGVSRVTRIEVDVEGMRDVLLAGVAEGESAESDLQQMIVLYCVLHLLVDVLVTVVLLHLL